MGGDPDLEKRGGCREKGAHDGPPDCLLRGRARPAGLYRGRRGESGESPGEIRRGALGAAQGVRWTKREARTRQDYGASLPRRGLGRTPRQASAIARATRGDSAPLPDHEPYGGRDPVALRAADLA